MPYVPIADYGLIGNCHTAALVTRDGSVDWLCLPRFDSPALFCRILDDERGGHWSIHPNVPFKSTHRYLPATNVLETTFDCDQGRIRLLDCMDVTGGESATPHVVPGMLIRVVEGIEGTVEVVSRCAPRPDYGRSAPDVRVQGNLAKQGIFRLRGPADWAWDERTATLSCRMTVHPGERIAWTLSADASQRTEDVEPGRALEATIAFWQHWAARCSYEGPYHDAVVRSALTLKLLSDEPSGAIIAAPTTSLPETIGGTRNWDYRFTWMRDASFTLYALLLAGYSEGESPFFHWIVETVKIRGTGMQILYPISSAGHIAEQILAHLHGYRDSRPVRIGNAASQQRQLDVYGEVLDALFFATKAGGYDPTPVWDQFRPLVDWAADNWQHPENGIWEVRGGERHFVYGKVMVWVALDRAIKLTQSHHLAGDVERWRAVRDAIRAEVFAKGWSEHLQAFKQSYEDDRLDAANLLLPVVGFIDGRDPKMISTVDATLKGLVEDGLCYRYRAAPDGIGGGEASFVLCTFWLIDALILTGRTAEAQDLFEQMLKHATPLGLFAEELDPHTGAHLGNFPQAFSHIGVINAAVSLAHVGRTGLVREAHRQAANQAGTGGGGVQQV